MIRSDGPVVIIAGVMTMVERARFLLVDDEETFLHSTAELLRREGYDCDCAPDAASATEMLRNRRYDLLIADIKMPGNAELEFIKDIPRIADGIPVILVTAYPTLMTAIRSIQLRVAAYLVKPIDLNELLDQVKISLSYSRVMHSVQETRKRLEEWGDDLCRIEQAMAGPGERPAATSLDAFLELNFGNIVNLLSDLKYLTKKVSAEKSQPMEACHLFNCPKLLAFKEALIDSIEVLEKTKSSFKSKELGDLRKRLESVLKEETV